MSLALQEHILSMINDILPTFMSSSSANETFDRFFRDYCKRSHAFDDSICKYLDLISWHTLTLRKKNHSINHLLSFLGEDNFGTGIFIFYISKVGTFTWNFMDLFIMLVQLYYGFNALKHRIALKNETSVQNEKKIALWLPRGFRIIRGCVTFHALACVKSTGAVRAGEKSNIKFKLRIIAWLSILYEWLK